MSDKTIRELIQNTNLDKLDTKLLLRHVLQLSQSGLIINNERVLNSFELEQFDTLVEKCKNGLPISYILGFKEFYSRKFKVTPDTLIPRPETEVLVDEVLRIAHTDSKILDLGTGTACIAITCKLEMPNLFVTAVDKYVNTLSVAKENSQFLNAKVDFICSDWYTNVEGKFDIIVSNPPYIEKNDPYLDNLKYEPQYALTDFANGLTCYEKIISGAMEHLHLGGHVLLEHGYLQKDAVTAIFNAYGFCEIKTIQDYANLDRITMARLYK